MKFSVIVPAYNSEKYIEDCIKSIMRQTYDNVEHIIVDGGSTDGTLDIIKKYGLPQDWNDDGKYGPERYIEAHIWSDETIEKYMNEKYGL